MRNIKTQNKLLNKNTCPIVKQTNKWEAISQTNRQTQYFHHSVSISNFPSQLTTIYLGRMVAKKQPKISELFSKKCKSD